jgi:hemolysin activation/secretion protein
MRSLVAHNKTLILSIAFLIGSSTSLFAAPPDAGSIRRDVGDRIQQTPDVPHSESLAPSGNARPDQPESSDKLSVRKFVITGATIFSQEELLKVLDFNTEKMLSLSEMEKAATKITNFYSARGYLAKALIPAQNMHDGIVTIEVIEARLGSVKVTKNSCVRLNRSRASRFVTYSQPIGELIRIKNLEKGLLLLQETPGVHSSTIIRPGKNQPLVDALITLDTAPLFTGYADVDNFGNIDTGEHRVSAGINIDSPRCIGDRVSLKSVYSSGIHYGRALYSIPLGPRGTRVSLSMSTLKYTLGGEYASLNATGRSFTAGTMVSHPLIITRGSNLYGLLGYDYHRFVDEVSQITTSDKTIHTGTLGLAGGWYDELLGGGYMSAGGILTIGTLDLSRIADLQQTDIAGPSTAGGYQKLNVSLARTQQLLDNRLRLVVSLTGQIASGNLDSSEKFSLGGPEGVRAYAASEGTGDEGFIMTAELSKALSPSAQLFGFFDYGQIRQFVTTWDGWAPDAGTPNTYSLNGAGIGVRWTPVQKLSIKATVVTRLSSNPSPSRNGLDNDGTKREPRFWFESSYAF